MRKKVVKASKGPKEKAFTCPKCHNNTLYDLSESVTRVADVDHGDQFICDECGAEFYAQPQHDGTIQFKTKKPKGRQTYKEISAAKAKPKTSINAWYVGEPSNFAANGHSYWDSPNRWGDKLAKVKEAVSSIPNVKLAGSTSWIANVADSHGNRIYRFDFWEDKKSLEDQLKEFYAICSKLGDNVTASTYLEDANYDPVEASLVEAPQSVVDELIAILARYGFVLDPRYAGNNPGKTWFGDTHLQVINEDSHVDEYDDNLRKYVPEAMVNAIHELDERTDCPITYNFGADRNGFVTGGLDIHKQYVDDGLDNIDSAAQPIESADYGGAYDIDPEMFFTKEDIMEFGNEVCEKLTEKFDKPFDIADTYIELPQQLSLFVSDPDWNEYSCSVPLDMRRIKIPADLTRKYLDTFVDSLSADIEKDAEIYSATALPEGQIRRKAKDLHDELLETAADLLQSADFGFDLSDVADMLTIDVQTPRQPNDPIRVELRCELSYSGMRKLEDALDSVVQQYDADAYFDDVEPGIAEAFIRV